jgi:hypothetical protein
MNMAAIRFRPLAGIISLLLAAGLTGCGGNTPAASSSPAATVTQTFTPITPATIGDVGTVAVKPVGVAADGSNADQFGKLDPQTLNGATGTVLTVDDGAGLSVTPTTTTGTPVAMQASTLQLTVDPATGALRTNAAALLPPGPVTLRLVNGKISVEDSSTFQTAMRGIQTPLTIRDLALHFTVDTAGMDGQGHPIYTTTLPQTLEWQFQRANGKYLLKDSFVRLRFGGTFVAPNTAPVIKVTLYDGTNTLMSLTKTATDIGDGIYEFRAASNATTFTGVAIDLELRDAL